MKKCEVVTKGGKEQGRGSSSTSTVSLRSVSYGQCQKNHAAKSGGYAVDGCREFMAAGEDGTRDALNCAACGCHRNFHRREVDADQS